LQLFNKTVSIQLEPLFVHYQAHQVERRHEAGMEEMGETHKNIIERA
jgi:hypothetical protein